MVQEDVEEPTLDAEELMHLALKAMGQDRDDEALLFLKHAIILDPEDGTLHYLLGALHAELGMRSRGITEITHAVQLNPELHVGVFQLGLLHLEEGDVATAQQAWVSLGDLEPENPLRIFAQGMLQFLDGDYAAAIATLEHGCQLNDLAESLNENIYQIIEQARLLLEEKPADDKVPAAAPRAPENVPASDTQHVLLGGYLKRDDKRQ